MGVFLLKKLAWVDSIIWHKELVCLKIDTEGQPVPVARISGHQFSPFNWV